MNEVKILNIGGMDQNIKDQYVRDMIAPSENGLDSSTNLPVSSRHYDVGEYLIGQDRQYYIAITDIEVGDTLVVGTNIRATTVSDEIIALKNQSADTVLEVIADVETSATASKGYSVGSYLYWNYGLSAGMYKVIAEISDSDALVVDTNIEAADKIMNIISGIESKMATIKYSNPNLLDNPWFTVNQRGKSSYSEIGYMVDRWRQWLANTVVITENGINGEGLQIYQYLESSVTKLLLNKYVTLSVMYQDGTIYHKSIKMPSTLPSTQTIIFSEFMTNNTHMAMIIETDGKLGITIRNYNESNIALRAVKLEVGSVSTLANDTAPNYAEELAKCQRYFYRAGGDAIRYTKFGTGNTTTNRNGGFLIDVPVPMRTRPAVTIVNTAQTGTTGRIYIESYLGNGNFTRNFDISCTYVAGDNYHIFIDVTSADTTTYNSYAPSNLIGQPQAYIDFTADL